MRSRGSKAAIAATSVVLSVAVAACGSSKSKGGTTPPPSSAGSSSSSSQGVPPSFNAASTHLVNPSTATGGTLNFVSTSDVDSMDGDRSYYANTWDMQRLFLRGLTAYDAKPGANGALVVPDMATDLGKHSDDYKTWTYTMRDGLKYEDGTAITSKDIKYAVERNFAQDVLPGGPVYLQQLLDDGSKYPGPYKDTDPNHLGLKTVETPDDKTIIFHLNAAYPDFPYVMALPGDAPVPMKTDLDPKNGQANYQFHVVSSGPYKFDKYDPGKQVVWVKNPNWDKSTDPVRSQLVDKIVLTQGLDADEMDKRLLAGTADIEVEGTGVQTTAQTTILRDDSIKKYAANPITGFTRYFAINTQVPEFQNVDCRKAVQYAMDKVALQNARGGPIGGGDIATSMTPPSLPGYQKIDPYPDGADHTGDVDQAKAELAKCGKPGGFTTNIATTNKGKGPKVATALQQALAKVGITAQIQQFDAATYYSTTIGTPQNVHDKDLGIMVAGWGPDWPDGFGFYSSIADGRKILKSGNSNYSELNDPVVNDALDKLGSAKDEATKEGIVAAIDKEIMDQAVMAPFVWDKALIYANPRVTNLYITGAFGIYDFVSMGVSDGK